MPPLEITAEPHVRGIAPIVPVIAFRLMPELAVKRHPEASADTAAPPSRSRRRGAIASAAALLSNDSAEAEKKLARAARSAARLAELSAAQRERQRGQTLDLFAEDAERAALQAMNTDIRQGTFEGFELPDVFLAAVQARGPRRSGKRGPYTPEA